MVHVVQVANFYGPRSGGLRTAVDELGAGYVESGHCVTLVVPGREYRDTIAATGVRRIELPGVRLPLTGGYRVVRKRAVTTLLRDLSPDVLEVSDRSTLRGLGRWARRHRVASVMISHERLDRLLAQVLPPTLARRAADVANRATSRTYDTVVCTTRFAREEFDRLGTPNVREVSFGVDLEMFHPRNRSELLRDRFADHGSSLVVHCGRLSVEKHVDKSIDAIADLRRRGIDARLVVAGDGPLMPRLRTRARDLPVTFLGHVPGRRDVAALLATADVVIAPGPHETFGLAALEALASGTPVVVSAHSALADMVTRDCGAAASGTATSFADALDSVLRRPISRSRESSRARAELFGWPSAVDAMLDTFAV